MRKRILIAVAAIFVCTAVSSYTLRHPPAAARIKMAQCLRTITIAGAATAPATTRSDPEAQRMWALLGGGGQIVLMRHARTTPGTGDPPNFDLHDRATQRNLSAEGRAQAMSIGKALVAHHIPIAGVFSSQLFRAQDTAQLALGRVDANAILNPLFEKEPERGEQLSALTKLVSKLPSNGNMVLVTHQTDITALTSQTPQMGECVILTPSGNTFVVAGSLKAF